MPLNEKALYCECGHVVPIPGWAQGEAPEGGEHHCCHPVYPAYVPCTRPHYPQWTWTSPFTYGPTVVTGGATITSSAATTGYITPTNDGNVTPT